MIEFKTNEKYIDNNWKKMDVVWRNSYEIIEEFHEKLSKLYKELNINIYNAEVNSIHAQGREGGGYFNSRVKITYKNDYGVTNFGQFCLSCFPDCCGIALLTAYYGQYAYENKNIPLILKLAKAIAENQGYGSLLLTFPNDNTSYYNALPKILEQERFEAINKSPRRNKHYETQLVTYTCNNLEDSKINLQKYYTEYANIAKKEEVGSELTANTEEITY